MYPPPRHGGVMCRSKLKNDNSNNKGESTGVVAQYVALGTADSKFAGSSPARTNGRRYLRVNCKKLKLQTTGKFLI